jgi:hypothetical protein
MTKQQIERFVKAFYPDEDIILADGLEDAFMGVAQQFTQTHAVYDKEKVIDILIERDGMTEQEAEEFFDFNILGAYVGESTPAFLFFPTCPSCGAIRCED